MDGAVGAGQGEIGRGVADGEFACELVSVGSEFSAASVVLGAAAAGARAYTASSSQGLLLMAEVLFDIAGMRVPLVLTCANRAVSAPLSIWNDQQDSMAVRDAGWIQLYCQDNQEAVDATIQAFRIAERCELPVMVCVDGFTLTHTLEPIDLPDRELVDGFLPPYVFQRALDPNHARSIGMLVGPEHYSEARHAHHRALERSTAEIESAFADWRELTGRGDAALIAVDDVPGARIGVLTIGSVFGTLVEARDAYPDLDPVRLMRMRAFRPFPFEALHVACAGLDELIVVERALSPGAGGILANEVRAALYGAAGAPRVHGFAIGLGGRDMPVELYPRIIEQAQAATPARFSVLDLVAERLAVEEH